MSFAAVHALNVFLGTGAILLQALSALAILVLILSPKRSAYLAYIKKHYLWLGFLVSLAAALGSLAYSEVVGFVPCHLCWYQRVFLFPMVLLYGVAAWKRDREVTKYIVPLLSVGLLISLYHNFNYYFSEAGSTLPCDASGVSCYQQLVSVFGGYISIPMLSLTSFLGILALVLVARFYKKAE